MVKSGESFVKNCKSPQHPSFYLMFQHPAYYLLEPLPHTHTPVYSEPKSKWSTVDLQRALPKLARIVKYFSKYFSNILKKSF